MDKANGRKKILFLIDSLTRGGAERLTVNLANNLDRERFEPIVVCVNGLGGEKNYKDELNVVPVIFDTEIRDFKEIVAKIPRIIRIIKNIRRIIKRENIGLIQSSLEISDLYTAILKVLNPRLKIISVRVNTNPSRKKGLWRRINTFVLRGANKVVCVSNTVSSFSKEHYNVPDHKLRTIYISVNLESINQAKPLPSNKIYGLGAGRGVIFLGVGRLVEQKNFLTLIEAFSEIGDSKAVLIIVGGGPLETEIREMIGQKGLEMRVILKGPTKEIFRYYKTADVFVLPSRWEGQPLVIVEAMAAGLPIITSNIAPLAELIEHNRTGILVNNKEELIAAMQELIGSEKKRKQLGNAAKTEVSKKFSIKRMAREYQEVYEELLIGKGA